MLAKKKYLTAPYNYIGFGTLDHFNFLNIFNLCSLQLIVENHIDISKFVRNSSPLYEFCLQKEERYTLMTIMKNTSTISILIQDWRNKFNKIVMIFCFLRCIFAPHIIIYTTPQVLFINP